MVDKKDPPSLFEQLKKSSQDFLKNIDHPAQDVLTEDQKIKEARRKDREALVNKIAPGLMKDTGFKSAYESLKALREQRKTDPFGLNQKSEEENSKTDSLKTGLSDLLNAVNLVGQKVLEEVKGFGTTISSSRESSDNFSPNEGAPAKSDSDAPGATPQSQTLPLGPPKQEVSAEILNRMRSLLKEMTGNAPQIASITRWGELDKLTAAVRVAWVSVLSQGAAAKSSGHHWLNEWEKIVKDIRSACDIWPAQYQQTWESWAATSLNEIENLRPWFSVAPHNEVQIDAVLMVPSAYKRKGVIPSPPKNVPENLIFHLQSCADYYEFVCSKKNDFLWANSPTKHAFEQGRKNLEVWKTENQIQEEWKEKALTRYSILEGRLTLKAIKSASSTPSKKRIP